MRLPDKWYIRGCDDLFNYFYFRQHDNLIIRSLGAIPSVCFFVVKGKWDFSLSEKTMSKKYVEIQFSDYLENVII